MYHSSEKKKKLATYSTEKKPSSFQTCFRQTAVLIS